MRRPPDGRPGRVAIFRDAGKRPAAPKMYRLRRSVARESAVRISCKNQLNAWSPKRKRTNSRWPSMGINYPANRPDPDDPGGLGAEESGAERTGPTQDFLFATRKGGRRAEVGRYYDSANVPVTLCFRPEISRGRSVARRSRHGPLAEEVSRRDHVVRVTGDKT